MATPPTHYSTPALSDCKISSSKFDINVVEHWLSRVILAVSQISKELKQHYQIENLDDVRIIRDRQTSTRI